MDNIRYRRVFAIAFVLALGWHLGGIALGFVPWVLGTVIGTLMGPAGFPV